MFHRRKRKGPATDVAIGAVFASFGWYYLAAAGAPELCAGQAPGDACLLGTNGFAGFLVLLGAVFVASGLKRTVEKRRAEP
jgi:hypothetical protein